MTGVTTPRLKHLLPAIITFWVVALAACGPQYAGHNAGLDAISPDSRWATIVEHKVEHIGESPVLRLVRLDLESGERVILAEDIEPHSESSFSPDGNYVLFRAPDRWALKDTSTGQEAWVATEQESVQFLPGGKLLVISLADNLMQFHVADSAHPQKSLLVGQVRYIFPSQPTDLKRWLWRLVGTPNCACPAASNRVLGAIIDADGAVSILVDTADGPLVDEIPPEMSDGITALLDRQKNTVAALLASEREQLKEEIKQQAADTGEALSDEELESRVEEQFRDAVFLHMGLTVFGVLSPDGTKLFFLRIGHGEGDKELYSLYLVDLTTGAQQVLSSETEWEPSFTFSPDGRQILFESNRDGGRSLYLANSDGSDILRIVEQGALNPCWY